MMKIVSELKGISCQWGASCLSIIGESIKSCMYKYFLWNIIGGKCAVYIFLQVMWPFALAEVGLLGVGIRRAPWWYDVLK